MKQTTVNFGAIKDTIYKFAGKNLISEIQEGGITILNAFMKEIKENSILKKQYLVYKNFEDGSCKKERLAERFIAENLKLIEGVDWNELLKTNKQIRLGLLENCHVEGNSSKQDLYESIHVLIKSVTQQGFDEVQKSQEAYDYVVDYLLKERKNTTPETIQEETEYPKFLSRKFITNLAVNKFNERYSHLQENEKSLLKTLLSPVENKKNYLIDLKEENLSKINHVISSDKSIDEKTSSALNGFKSKIESINEGNITLDELDDAIINLSELKEELNGFER